MKTRRSIALVLAAAVIGGQVAVKVWPIGTSVAASGEAAQGALVATGSVTAVQSVNVTAESIGRVREVVFESGAIVAAGDVLVRLDTSAEEIQLRAIEVQVETARINAQRVDQLRTNNMVAQSEWDAAHATLKQTQTDADAVRAVIAAMTIRAPFAGQLGVFLVNAGELVNPGKPVVSLQSLAPIHVDFSLPEKELARLQIGIRVRLTGDRQGSNQRKPRFTTNAYTGKQLDGALTRISPGIDAVTRSVKLQATFANEDRLLRPGMSVRVEVLPAGE